MSTKTYTDFNAGERVEGTYYGLPFTGTIASLRWHSIRNDVREVLVNTDGFQYKGEPRERLLVCVGEDGGIANGFGQSTLTHI
jgi:hypothetical protein